MADVDAFTRSYLFVDVAEPPTSDAVAGLFDAAAAALRAHGAVTVHHVAFEAADHVEGAVTSLVVYYDRVERRRTHRA